MESAQCDRSLLRRAADFLFGYDFFICYAWADGRAYAVTLEHALEAMGFECFLDSSDYAKGEDRRLAGRWAIRKTSRLNLVGSPASLEREPVLREIEAFHSTGRTIVPISFGASLFPTDRSGSLFRFLSQDILALKEPSDRLALPSGFHQTSPRNLENPPSVVPRQQPVTVARSIRSPTLGRGHVR